MNINIKLKDNFALNKAFFISLCTIALPIAFQNVIGLAVNLMDNLMLGKLGDVAMAAASLGGQPFFILMIIGFGFSSGGSVLIAQYWGKGDKDVIKQVISLTMRFILVISIIFTAVAFFFAEPIMRLYSTEPDVIAAGTSYLSLLCFSFVFYSTTNCFLSCLRAVELVRASSIIYGISLFINVFFNYIFIFGHLGAPALGVRGAAVGTVIAHFCELIMAIVYMYFIEDRIYMRLSDFLKFNKDLFADFLRYSLPVAGNELIWSVGFSATTLIIGRIGSHFVAANSIASIVFQIAGAFTFGIGGAAAVMCGKCIGSGKTETEAQKLANSLILVGIAVGTMAGALIFFTGRSFAELFNVSQPAKELAVQMMIVLSVFSPLAAIDCVTIIGILRGGGDTKTSLFIDCSGVWFVGIPLGVIFGLWLKIPPVFVYILLRSDTIYKTILGLLRVNSRKWIRNITRDKPLDH